MNRVSERERHFIEALQAAGVAISHQAKVAGWNVDGFVSSANLVVEFDGVYWHSLPKAKERDKRKDREIRAAGFRVVRVPEEIYAEDVERAIELVTEAIANAA